MFVIINSTLVIIYALTKQGTEMVNDKATALLKLSLHLERPDNENDENIIEISPFDPYKFELSEDTIVELDLDNVCQYFIFNSVEAENYLGIEIASVKSGTN